MYAFFKTDRAASHLAPPSEPLFFLGKTTMEEAKKWSYRPFPEIAF
jgi:hypothetical protein